MFENSTCPGADGCAMTTARQFLGRKHGQYKAWDLISTRRHHTHLQSLVLVEPPRRYGLEQLLQHKRLCHSLESKRIWFLRVCSNRLKASAHYFSCFPEFQRNFKTLPASWGFIWSAKESNWADSGSSALWGKLLSSPCQCFLNQSQRQST